MDSLKTEKYSEQILEEAYRKYKNPLMKNAYAYVHDYCLAEDCVHEAFLVLHRYLSNSSLTESTKSPIEAKSTQNPDEINIPAFLSRVVKTTAFKYFNSQCREQAAGDFSSDEISLFDDSFELSRSQREDEEFLTSKLNCLSPRCRSAVVMRYLQSMEFKDIAEVLGISEAGAKKLIQRSLLELRKYIADS